jgi:hypothetical protein
VVWFVPTVWSLSGMLRSWMASRIKRVSLTYGFVTRRRRKRFVAGVVS